MQSSLQEDVHNASRWLFQPIPLSGVFLFLLKNVNAARHIECLLEFVKVYVRSSINH